MTDSVRVCGTGGWAGPLPGDPSSPLGLSAVGRYGWIEITWQLPNLNPGAVGYTTVYRGSINNFAQATALVSVGGNQYLDPHNENDLGTYFYWVRTTSINGTPGELVGPVSASALPSIDKVISQLSNRISSGHLATHLQQEIARISLLNTALNEEINSRSSGEQGMADALGMMQGNLDETRTLVLTETAERVDGQTALANSLNAVAVATSNASAAVAEERAARIDALGALASEITRVETTLGDDIASAETRLQTNINLAGDRITGLGALYSAKVNVNGLIGGFGIYNDGTTVEAGFDVNTFWIGSSAGNKRKPFIVSNGIVYIDSATISTINANQINTNGLIVRDSFGIPLFGAGVPLDFSNVGGTTKPAAGATRNVFRGNWSSGTAYDAGDIVVDGAGYGWSATQNHVAGGSFLTPAYPDTSNTYWTLFTVRGGSSLMAILSNETHTFPADSAGNVTAGNYVESGTTISVFEGADTLAYDGVGTALGTWKVVATGNNITPGGVSDSGSYATVEQHSNATADTASISYLITGKTKTGIAFSITRQQTFSKSKAGTAGISQEAINYDVEIESTNGTEFRVGQNTQTLLKAHVFRNDSEVTADIPESWFRWRRVSLFPQPPPNDDATWNTAYASGYRQVNVSVDDVAAKATFFLDIVRPD